MNRPVLAACLSIGLLETTFYSVLSPLLPTYEDEYGFSETTIGLIVSAYSLGAVVGALPTAAILRRASVRTTVVSSLLLLAASTVAFGLVRDPAVMAASRFLSGLFGSIAWTTAMVWVDRASAPAQRGRMVGIVLGGGYLGATAGPLVGAGALAVGPTSAFLATGVVCCALSAVCARIAGGLTPAASDTTSDARAPGLSRLSWAVLVLFFASASLTGVRLTVEPLQLSAANLGEITIAVTFGVAAIGMAFIAIRAGAVTRPPTVRRLLRAGIGCTLAVACGASLQLSPVAMVALAVALGAALQLIWTPALALLGEQSRTGGGAAESTWAGVAFAFAAGTYSGSLLSSVVAQHASYTAAWAPLIALTAGASIWLARAGGLAPVR